MVENRRGTSAADGLENLTSDVLGFQRRVGNFGTEALGGRSRKSLIRPQQTATCIPHRPYRSEYAKAK